MSNKTLLKHLLHVKHTVIDSSKIDEESDAVIISAHPTKAHSHNCPICGKRCSCYDSGKGLRRWRALDWGFTKVFIEAPAIRIECPEHGVHTAAVPWARHHSTFTRYFENTAAWMALYLPKNAVAEYMRISWNTVGPIISRFKADADPMPEHRFNNLKHIGIDETSYRKGHTYITVVVNHDTNSVIWVHDRHGKEVLREFFETLSEEQRNTIECVTADGARWISETMDEYIPNAHRCLDMYHMVEWAQDAVDEVRTDSWQRARQADKRIKRDRGRPRKGQELDKTADRIKHTRYALGKAPENLTEKQAAQLAYIANTDHKLYKAYQLKEYLRTLVKLPLDQLETSLKDWLWKASHSQIKPIYELQKKIRRHYDAILNTVRYHLSNARIEAMNNQIKLIIRAAFGFRNIKNMIDMIMLKCSDIDVQLPYKAMKLTHSS
jgi:transposase